MNRYRIKLSATLLLAASAFCARAQDNKFPEGVFGTWGHGPEISNSIIRTMPPIRGWNFTFPWKVIEPSKGKFNWSLFDNQLNEAANDDLYIGFMIWAGQNSPDWVYSEDGVPKVLVNDRLQHAPFFPYYFSPAYKADYQHMLESVFAHLKAMPAKTRAKMLFWMSAEGSTGDEGPYKGVVKDPQYDISMNDWFDFKKTVWSYMYAEGKKLSPQLNILINQANNGMYLPWLLQNTPTTWFKAGSLAHTYSFNGELDYYERLKQIVKPDNDGMTNRFRSESEEVQQLGWFAQSPQQNTFNIAVSAASIGLDMMNVRKNATLEAGGNYPFLFFTKYAGHRNPAASPGAFCVLRDVLDAADTKRFPESEFGPVVKAGTTVQRKRIMANGDEGSGPRLLKDVNPARVDAILAKFTAYGAQKGPSADLEAKIYADDFKLRPNLRKDGIRPDLQDKYNNDMGMNLLPDNYNKFLTQYEPNKTSRGYWRVGPTDQPFGRYARGFDHTAGMSEMWFTLDPKFYADNAATHKLKVVVAYYDKSNCKWSLNYGSSKGKTEGYQIQCKGLDKWIVKEIMLNDAVTTRKLEHDSDFSIKYLSGDDTKFSMIEITRL